MTVVLISVVRDQAMYAKCVKDNPFTRGCERFAIDNRERNEGIPTCYNRFLEARPADEEAWYVFCHEDFELKEDLAARLGGLDPAALWGPVGAATRVRFGLYHQWRMLGSVEECRKDGTDRRVIGARVSEGTPVETFDCQCLIVHSSLVRRHRLRFDEALTFDLYAEEFCMAARERAGVVSRILPLTACHWSGGSVQPRYYEQEAHVNAKYPNVCYTGTSSWILGGRPPRGRRLTVGAKNLVRAFGRFRARLGDFWWYSLLLFVALRCGDVINAVVGLWLVPKYVPMEELGAVLPLLQITGFFGFPLTILVITFTKFLNHYQTVGERGKVKSLIRTFWSFASLAVLLGTAVALWLMPHFFERIRVSSGSLTVLIIAASVLGTTAPVFTNALQALKKFNTLTAINLLSAPIRLITMLVAMPFRALSGYMLGQTTPQAFQIVVSIFALRREIRNDVESVPFWKDDWKPILRYAGFVTLGFVAGTFLTIVQPIIVRQRLPEVESAAYYMISRFSDFATFAGQTLVSIIFPFAAEAQSRNKTAFPLFLKGTAALFAFGTLCAVGFALFGSSLLNLLPEWRTYAAYAPDMAFLALISTFAVFGMFFATYENAGSRFGYLVYCGIISTLYAGFLVCFAAPEYFNGILPDGIVGWMQSFKIATLRGYLWSFFAYQLVATLAVTVHLVCRERKRTRPPSRFLV